MSHKALIGYITSYLGSDDPSLKDVLNDIRMEADLIDKYDKPSQFIDTSDIELNEKDFKILKILERKDYKIYFLRCLYDRYLLVALERQIKRGRKNEVTGLLRERPFKDIPI